MPNVMERATFLSKSKLIGIGRDTTHAYPHLGLMYMYAA